MPPVVFDGMGRCLRAIFTLPVNLCRASKNGSFTREVVADVNTQNTLTVEPFMRDNNSVLAKENDRKQPIDKPLRCKNDADAKPWDTLGVDCFRHILSYVWRSGDPNIDENLSFYQSYALVSTRWWRVTQHFIRIESATPKGIRLSLNGDSIADSEAYMDWLCDPQRVVRRISCSSAGLTCAARVVRECSSAKLRLFETQLHLDGSIQPADSQRILQEVLLENCPQLDNLSLVFISATLPTLPSPSRTARFTRRHRQKEDMVSLPPVSEREAFEVAVRRFISVFPHLTSLSLGAHGFSRFPYIRIDIQSQTLRTLRIKNPSILVAIGGYFVLSCPELRTIHPAISSLTTISIHRKTPEERAAQRARYAEAGVVFRDGPYQPNDGGARMVFYFSEMVHDDCVLRGLDLLAWGSDPREVAR